MKICLICSPGGHLTELSQLKNAWKGYEHFYITFKEETSKYLKNVYYITDPKRSPLKLFKNFFQSLKILIKENPDVLITTGGGIAVPGCYIGKFLGKKIIYIESFCRTENPSLTGKLLYPVSDIFLVQWRKLLKKYGKKALYKGRIF